MTPIVDRGAHVSWQLVALILLVLAGESANWLFTPEAHPGAPPLQIAAVVAQGLLAAAGALWCWHHGHRDRHTLRTT